MRKLSTQIQTTPLEGAPTQGALRQNILGDLGSINAYDEARFLAIAALKDATIRQALQQKKDPILTKANEVAGAVIETVQKDPVANEILPELASYYTRVHDNFKKSLEKATLRWSQADPQEAEDVVRQINTLLKDYPALGILHPAEYPPFPQNQAFAKFYMDTMNLANTMQNQNQLTEDDATELVARVLAAVHGKTVSASGSRRTNPLHKLGPYITTTPTNSYAIPAARVISEAIQKSQEFGLDAVTEAIKRAEQKTNQAIKKWTDAMLATLRRDPNDRNKLNRIRDKIEQKLQNIQRQYGIEVPDLQSMDDDKKRSYYLRMLENTVQTLIGQTEANKLFLNPRTREGQEITVTPRETTSPEMFTPAQGAFQHEKSTAAMGGVPTMPSTRAEFLREAQRSTTPEATYKEQMESLMTQHWLIFGLMGGFIARSIATEMLRQELANLEESEEQVENNEIKIGLTRGAGPGQVAVRSVTIEMENEEGNTEELRVPTYGPVGLPFGRGEFGLQPTTLAGINTTIVEQNIALAGNVRFANAVVIGGHLIQIGSDENASNANITISGKNPQAVETRSIIPVAFEGQTTLTSYQREIEHSILVPKIKVEKIGDDRYRVQATVGQATAPSITQQEIDSIMVLIKGDPNRRIRSFRERLIQSYTKQKRDGSTTVRIPFSQLPLYETLKAIENSSNPQLHSAQLIVRRENLDPNKDEIERNVSLQLTFYIPENDRRLVAEEQQPGSPPTSIGTVKRGMFGRSKYGEAQFMAQQEQTGRQSQQQEMELEDEGEEPIQEEIRTAQIEPPEEITTPASRMVYVTLEINIKGLMEAINWQELETRENEQANPVNEVRKIIRKLYEQAKTSMNAAQPIDTTEAEQMFEKTDIKKAELNEAVQEATKYVHYQIIRKIRLGLNKHNIPNEFAAQIRPEYATQLDAARNNPAEFELIAAQSALRPKHFEGITYTARPQVIRNNNGSVELSLNVMGAARSTPIKIEFVGIDPNTELNTIVNVYRGISEQNKKSISDGYSGTIIANYSLNQEEVTNRPRVTQLKASRNANQISFAPDTHLTSGASGLPAGIITTIQPSSQTEAVAETNAAIVATRETTTDTGAGQAQSPAFDPDLAIGLDDFSDITMENETNAGMGETGQADENEITRAERPQAPIQQADDTANETNARQTQEAERSDNYKVRIYIFSDGGTTDQTNRSFRPTGVGVSVYYVIEKEDGTKEFKGVYIKHYLGDHPNLTNNIAEVYAATIGLTFARAVIEDAIRKGYINEPSEAQILVVSDSQNALKWITGNQGANEGAIPAFVKNAAQLVRFNIEGETKFATIKGVYQREGTNSHMARLIKKSNDGSQAVRENANERTKIEIIDPNQAQQDVQAIQDELAITRKLTYEPNHDHPNFREVQAFNFTDLTDLSVVPSPAAEGRVPPIRPLNLQGVLQQLIGQTTETPVATNEIVTEDEGNLFEDMDETELNEAIKAIEGDGTRRPFGSRARQERIQSLRANRNRQDRAADTRQARRDEASPEPTPEPAPAQTPAPTPAPAPQGSLLEIAVGKTTTNLDTTNNWVNINNTLIQPPAQRQPNQEPIKQIGKITKTPKTLGGALRAEHRTSPNISQTASNFIQNVMGPNTFRNVSEVTQVTLPIDLIAGNASQGKHTYKPPQVGQQRTQQQNANRRTIDPNLPFVSFHGRRDASLEEMQQCFELGKKIAKSGAVLVVGGAIGADYAAMLGALSEGGKVIVVHHRDFAFDQNGYGNYTKRSLLELFNEAGRLYQRNNFVKQIADQIIRRTNRPVGQTAAEVVNKIAAIMTLVTISPHHPTLKAMGIDFPPTAEVLPTTMRIVTKENNQWTAKQAPFLRDKFMVLLTELTIGGPTRNNNSGTAKAVEFANQIAREMPEDVRDKAVMSMEAVLEMDDGDFRGLLEELNNKRQQNLQRYKQQQRER